MPEQVADGVYPEAREGILPFCTDSAYRGNVAGGYFNVFTDRGVCRRGLFYIVHKILLICP